VAAASDEDDDRSSFDCDREALNAWFHRHAPRLTVRAQPHIPSGPWHSASLSASGSAPVRFQPPTYGRHVRGDEVTMAKTKFRPLHDRVVVKRIEAEEKSAGGIIIPDTAREKPQQGQVTAVGPGGRDEAGKLIPIDLKVGDKVLFGKWSGTEVKLDGEELLIMKESDIMGVLV
jgi:chaperonin GroES